MSYFDSLSQQILSVPIENEQEKQIFEMSLEDYLIWKEKADIQGISIEQLEIISWKQVEGRNLMLWQGDITKLKVDAIVSSSNDTLLIQGGRGGGVESAINDAAGKLLTRECATLGGCETGDAKITKGYNLPAKTIIHVVGPVYHRDKQNAETLLRSCYRRCLELCDQHHLHSIAFFLISCGIYGYPLMEAALISLEVTGEYLQQNKTSSLTDIIFTSFSMHQTHLFQQVFEGKISDKEIKVIQTQ